MSADTSQKAMRLPRPSAFALLASGRQALREVPGLKMFLLKGFLLNYGIFVAVAALASYVIFWVMLEPYVMQLDEWVSGEGILWKALAMLLWLLTWLAKLLLLVAVLLFSLLFSLILMSMWFEALAARIVSHCRGGVGENRGRFTLIAWLGSLGHALRDGLRLLFLAFAAMLLALVPLAGPVLAILINGYLLGWEVRDPYLVVREVLGEERKQLRKGLMLWTVQAGLLPVFLAMIPILGWALLPGVMIYLVAGFAWRGEQALREAQA
ncbi:MAG: EI24 domain-containing protein [SAR324 cluster bacterium]|nr:EI24 domain-containing protein [SAR324 cluster bacterium]